MKLKEQIVVIDQSEALYIYEDSKCDYVVWTLPHERNIPELVPYLDKSVESIFIDYNGGIGILLSKS